MLGTVLVVLAPALALFAVYIGWRRRYAGPRGVVVLVLGDFGRSPRMQYHVTSLATTVPCVDVVAYRGSPPLASITKRDNVVIHSIPMPPALPPGLPRVAFLLYAPVKVLFQVQ